MKRYIKVALMGVSALAISAGSASAEYTLDILHINDQHSRVESINRFDSTCNEEDEAAGECFGGFARIKAKIDERRAALDNSNLLVLDAGDQFQGSLFYTTYGGEATVEFMNAIGFDAMAVGNHEFNRGPEVLAEFIEAAEFPVISGNTIATDDSPLAGVLGQPVVVERGGERIGIVSVLATNTAETSSPGDTISFQDEIEYLTGAVAELEADGINKIVLLSHVGLPRDREIAAAVDGIDVIVGGHSHTLLSNDDEDAADTYPVFIDNPSGTAVPIVQAYAYSKYVGEVRVVFDDEGNVTSAEGDPHLLDASVTPDEEIAARVAELKEPIQALMEEVVGESTGSIEGDRTVCRVEECEMGNLVADAMLDRVRNQGIQVAIQNGGGLRASIDEGDVTMGEVMTVLPFQNTLATFQLSGADIVASLENGVSEIEDGSGRFPQVSGLSYTFDVSAEPGSRISDVMIVDEDGNKTPIDESATYGVVSNNFMRKGGDGYSLFADNAQNAYDFGPGLEEVLADYLGQNNPYEPYLDGRIMAASAAMEDEGAMTEEPAAEEATEEASDASAEEANVEVPETGLNASELSSTGPAIDSGEAAAEEAGEAEAVVEVPETGLNAGDLSSTGPAIEVEEATSETMETAEEAATDVMDATEEAATDTMEAAEEVATDMMEATEEAATDVMDATEEAATDAMEATEEAATDAMEAVEDVATEAVGADEEAAKEAMEATDAMADGEMTKDDDAMEAKEEMADDAMSDEAPAEDAMTEEAPAEDAMADDAMSDETAIEEAASEDSMASGERTHVIEAGDTLWDLAQEFYGDPAMFTKLQEANPQFVDSGLVIGEELVIPE